MSDVETLPPVDHYDDDEDEDSERSSSPVLNFNFIPNSPPRTRVIRPTHEEDLIPEPPAYLIPFEHSDILDVDTQGVYLRECPHCFSPHQYNYVFCKDCQVVSCVNCFNSSPRCLRCRYFELRCITAVRYNSTVHQPELLVGMRGTTMEWMLVSDMLEVYPWETFCFIRHGRWRGRTITDDFMTELYTKSDGYIANSLNDLHASGTTDDDDGTHNDRSP